MWDEIAYPFLNFCISLLFLSFLYYIHYGSLFYFAYFLFYLTSSCVLYFPCMEFIIIYTIYVMNFITMKSIESDFFSTMLTMRPDVVHYRYSCPVISHQYWWYGQEGMKQGQLLYHMFTMRPEQNWRHFTDNIFKCIFVRENVRIFIQISMKFDHNGSVDNE